MATTYNNSAANVQYLSQKTGLAPSVAAAWLANEGQTVANPTNPLNIIAGGTPGQTGSSGGFGTYASPTAGLDAAAWLLKANSSYSNILAAIQSGTPLQQAQAIQNSSWATSHYNYTGISSMVSGISTPGGGASTPITTTPSQTNPGTNTGTTGHTLYDYLSQAGVNVNPTDTYASVKQAALTTFTNDKQFQPWMRSSPVLSALLNPYANTPISQIPWNSNAFSGSWNPTQPNSANTPGYTGASGAISNLIPDIPSALMFLGVIAIGLVLILTGGIITLKRK